MTDAEIESFIRAFEDGSLPKSEWTHARHIVMALWYLSRHGRCEATGLIRDGIKRYNERQGNRTGYHETITLAWVAVIERFLTIRDRNLAVSGLAGELLTECGDKDFLLRFYSRDRLFPTRNDPAGSIPTSPGPGSPIGSEGALSWTR